MAFFQYTQNNSGGSFEIDTDAGISTYVIVEAGSPEEADERAERIGIYFDPYYERDCDCCGTRWDEAWGYGSEVASLYGTPVKEYVPLFNWTGGAPHAFVHYADGRVESFGGNE